MMQFRLPRSSCCPLPALNVVALPQCTLLSVILHPVANCLPDQFCLHPGLGLGRTLHSEPAKEGEVTRKGISCERTFAAISSREDLEAKVGTAALRPAINRVPLSWTVILSSLGMVVHSPYVATGHRIWAVWFLQATAECFIHAARHARQV